MEPTKESIALRKLAKNLARQCPLALGEEIIAVGSAGLGCADTHSDLDIELIVNTLPSANKATSWLETVGALNLIPDGEAGEDELNISCQYKGVWLEAGWRTLASKEKLIQTVIAGQNTSRINLLQIGNLFHAIPLRSSGAWPRWQQTLSTYPDRVREQVIYSASEFWTFPHRVEMLWVLARRRELLGLTIWLTADVSDALRILFAINRQWEMDWKHLHAISQRLTIKPGQLTERIHEIFSAQQLTQRVEVAMQLFLDILALVPPSYDVAKAKRNMQRSLEDNWP